MPETRSLSADGRWDIRPSPEDIIAQLGRILASPEFKAPERAHKFLRYVVEEAVAGRSERIKAFAIAVEVFGRDANFDAQNDPVVRIEAGRLRRALERYYLVAGQDDPVRIDIPKGGYAPVFVEQQRQGNAPPAGPEPDEHVVPAPEAAPRSSVRRPVGWRTALVVVLSVGLLGALYLALNREGPSAEAGDESPNVPVLVVRPFTDLGAEADAALYAAGLTEEVLSQIARFREIRVLGSETSRSLPSTADAAELNRRLGIRYVLEGGVRIFGGRLRVTSRVVDAETSHVLWSQTYDEDLRSSDIVQIEVDIANKVATAVAQPYGIIFRADEQRSARLPPDDLEAYRCTLRFYSYRAVLSAEAHAAARDCLERAVTRYPSYATAWAMLSYIYLDEDRFGFNWRDKGGGPIERSLEAAQRAVRLDPENVRALQALMMALFFNREAEESLRVGERAFALNPNDTELLGEYGSRLAMAGHWQRGAELLEQALIRNPGNAGYYTGVLGLIAYMLGDNERAVKLIRRADMEKFPLYHVVAALIYARAGLAQEAAASRDLFLAMRPRFFDNLDEELAKRNYRPEDRRILTDAARAAGFPVP